MDQKNEILDTNDGNELPFRDTLKNKTLLFY